MKQLYIFLFLLIFCGVASHNLYGQGQPHLPPLPNRNQMAAVITMYPHGNNLPLNGQRFMKDVTNGWQLSHNITFDYDTAGRITNREFSHVTYLNKTREMVSYDSAGNITEYLNQHWLNNTWTNFTGQRFTYTYHPVYGITEIMGQIYSFNTSAWLANQKVSKIFDVVTGLQTEELHSHWNNTTQTWNDIVKIIYTYNAAGEVTEIMQKHFINGTWTDLYRTFDISWLKKNEQYQQASYNQLNLQTSQWTVPERLNFTTNSLNGDIYLIEKQVGGVWEPFHKTSNLKDHFSNIIQNISDTRDSSVWTTYNIRRNTFTYNPNGNLTEWITATWTQNTNQFTNNDRFLFSNFRGVVAGTKPKLFNKPITVYPNPTQNQLTINLSEAGKLEVTATLTDVTGKTVLQQIIIPGIIETHLSTQNLPAGIYLLQLQTDQLCQSFKIIRQ